SDHGCSISRTEIVISAQRQVVRRIDGPGPHSACRLRPDGRAMLAALLSALFDSLALLAQSNSVWLPVEFSAPALCHNAAGVGAQRTRAATSAGPGTSIRRVSCFSGLLVAIGIGTILMFWT